MGFTCFGIQQSTSYSREGQRLDSATAYDIPRRPYRDASRGQATSSAATFPLRFQFVVLRIAPVKHNKASDYDDDGVINHSGSVSFPETCRRPASNPRPANESGDVLFWSPWLGLSVVLMSLIWFTLILFLGLAQHNRARWEDGSMEVVSIVGHENQSDRLLLSVKYSSYSLLKNIMFAGFYASSQALTMLHVGIVRDVVPKTEFTNKDGLYRKSSRLSNEIGNREWISSRRKCLSSSPKGGDEAGLAAARTNPILRHDDWWTSPHTDRFPIVPCGHSVAAVAAHSRPADRVVPSCTSFRRRGIETSYEDLGASRRRVSPDTLQRR